MKILLIADPKGVGDEGARNISKNILSELEKRHEVLCIPARKLALSYIKAVLFRPDIIHSVHGPSRTTFHLLRLLRLTCKSAKYYMSMTHPNRNELFNNNTSWNAYTFINLLTQDPDVELLMKKQGFNCIPFPNGIDTDKFRPIANELPADLAERLPPGKKLLLHVGHIKASRGLDIMASINKTTDWHSIIIGSTRYPVEQECYEMLIDAGCTVYRGYIEDLPALYSSVDAYIFPVTDINGSIDMPLTVLEALSSGCPVLSTPFKALPKFLSADEHISYYSNESEAILALKNIAHPSRAAIHERMATYSWDYLIDRLIRIYNSSN